MPTKKPWRALIDVPEERVGRFTRTQIREVRAVREKREAREARARTKAERAKAEMAPTAAAPVPAPKPGLEGEVEMTRTKKPWVTPIRNDEEQAGRFTRTQIREALAIAHARREAKAARARAVRARTAPSAPQDGA